MTRPSLRTRLFLSHLVVMGVGLATLIGIGRVYSPRFFVIHLEQIERRGVSVRQVRTQLLQGFESAWSRGMVWAIIIGGGTAGGLSYWVSQRIMRPLVQMETITQKFAAGHLQERMPTSEIPELDRLATSFNQMARSLEGVEQRRRELVGDLTHELRTPLTIVGGYLEGLSDGTIEPSTDIYRRLGEETERLQRLIADLQELSKLEAGHLPIHLQPTDLRPILEDMVERFSAQFIPDQLTADGFPLGSNPTESLDLDATIPSCETQQPTLRLECPESLPFVLADPERVKQILINLLSNALRHTELGTVILQSWSETDRVWIAVIDTGEGIAPTDLPHVFERFWRADRSRDRHSGGTGIGLAICQQLVQRQGGEIEVESQLHQGSTFRFWLALA